MFFVWLLRPVVDYIIRERNADIEHASRCFNCDAYGNPDKTMTEARILANKQINANLIKNGSKYRL